jgi:acyl carrier protein
MKNDEVYKNLTLLFRDIFMRDNIVLQPSMSAKDIPGWDSFKQMQIIICVEEFFGVTISTKILDRLQTVGDLAEAIVALTEVR